MRALVKCSAMRARAASPSAARRAGSRARARMPSARAAASPTGTRRPETPSSIASSAPTGTDGELVGPEAELCALSGCLRARPSEAGELHALPEDVHLLGRPEALRRVPARRPVRDDDARVDRPPGEAIDPARPLELVGRTQEEDDAAAR